MYKTESEFKAQYAAISKTITLMKSRQAEIEVLKGSFKSIFFSGCGSSLCVSQSASLAVAKRLGVNTMAIASGDIMQNRKWWEGMFANSVVVFPSRSGATSEAIEAAKIAKSAGAVIVSICAVENSPLAEVSDITFEIPWAFDASVCQTRTVTTLYTACIAIVSILSSDNALMEELDKAISVGEAFLKINDEMLKNIAETVVFDNVVVLADTELRGIASEAAMAFVEIPQIPAVCYNILDVRHGPMMLIGKSTFVIVANVCNNQYTTDLIAHCKSKGAYVIAIGDEANSVADISIKTEKYSQHAAYGLPFINVVQAISFYKAIVNNVNPDAPEGLDPYIKL